MQRSGTNAAPAADVWFHVINVFGSNTHKNSGLMNSPAFYSISNQFQTVAISSDHEIATSFLSPSRSLSSDLLKLYFHLQYLQGQTVCSSDF